MEWPVALLVMLLFLLLKGFFSGSEIAIVNSDKLKLRHHAKQGDRRAALLLKMFRKPDVVLGTTLVGTNLATVIISTLGALICIQVFGESGDLISVLILTPFLLIFGEVVPKSVFQQKADTIAPKVSGLLRFFSYAFYPVIFIFSRVARFATRLVGGASTRQTLFITREELRALLDDGEPTGSIGTVDRQSIRRIIRFADTTVGQAMIPLPEVVGINEMRSTADAVMLVMKHGYNRLPVYRGNITNLKGVLTLSTWDLLDEGIDERPITDFIHPPLYLSPNQTIDQILPLLQEREDHMAIVVDEFGSGVGIITMEDVFEEVVGDIDVGYDFDEYRPKRHYFIESTGATAFRTAGRTPLSEINDVLHIKLPLTEAHTIGGFVTARLRRLAKDGDEIEEEGYRFIVERASDKTVLRVRAEQT
ncbi:hemolysin family protein [Thiorhodococcus minor]|uniref:HlyC/CorC family transporter n=1 Tax=Thiorhodococcus minor TaxID=57489 RepID=A0A6M0K181_9GAMM|nr:hemolysin family protein [Thiorhodococcus minor]NEV62653.1 HlyC/CorC family transporter [Thiorhodococcus minor]